MWPAGRPAIPCPFRRTGRSVKSVRIGMVARPARALNYVRGNTEAAFNAGRKQLCPLENRGLHLCARPSGAIFIPYRKEKDWSAKWTPPPPLARPSPRPANPRCRVWPAPCCGAFSVCDKRRNMEADLAHLSLLHVVIAGIIGAAVFVLFLVTLVRTITA